MPPLVQQPKSFFSSVMSGITGWFKGLLSGGLVGALAGAAIGAAILGGIAAFSTAGFVAAGGWALVGAGALAGAEIGALALGSIGATAGAITGVVKSREAAQPSAGQLVNALNMAHQHGEVVGKQQMVQQIMHAQQTQEHGTKHRDRVVSEQAAKAIAQAQAGHP